MTASSAARELILDKSGAAACRAVSEVSRKAVRKVVFMFLVLRCGCLVTGSFFLGSAELGNNQSQYFGKMAGVGKRSSGLALSLRYSSRGTWAWGQLAGRTRTTRVGRMPSMMRSVSKRI